MESKKVSWAAAIDKYGREVIERGVTLIPTLLLQNFGRLGVNPMEALVLLELMGCWDGKRPPFPTRKTLCRWTGRERRTLDRAIQTLIEKGRLGKTKLRSTEGRDRSNAYDLSGTLLELRRIAKEPKHGKDKPEKG